MIVAFDELPDQRASTGRKGTSQIRLMYETFGVDPSHLDPDGFQGAPVATASNISRFFARANNIQSTRSWFSSNDGVSCKLARLRVLASIRKHKDLPFAVRLECREGATFYQVCQFPLRIRNLPDQMRGQKDQATTTFYPPYERGFTQKNCLLPHGAEGLIEVTAGPSIVRGCFLPGISPGSGRGRSRIH